MDFSFRSVLSTMLASILLLFRNVYGLIVSPYATMRSISRNYDALQILIIFAGVYGYFAYGSVVRFRDLNPILLSSSASVSFIFFCVTFSIALLYFYLAGYVVGMRGKKASESMNSLLMTFAYSLLPTLLWFFMTSTLYALFPPPRYQTFLGSMFSILFIGASITLLWWRVMLWYLSLRFTYKTEFFRILIVMVGFALWFIPYAILLYRNGVSRIPFI